MVLLPKPGENAAQGIMRRLIETAHDRAAWEELRWRLVAASEGAVPDEEEQT